MYESAVNDNAEDFPKVSVDAYPIGIKFVSTFVDWGDQSLDPNIGEVSRLVKVGGIRRREQIMNKGLFSGEQQ
jgi:hypothetical protein